MSVVVKPGVLVMILSRQPDALLDVVRVELLLNVAPRIKPCCPDDVLLLISERNGCSQMIAVIVPNGDFSSLALLLFF